MSPNSHWPPLLAGVLLTLLGQAAAAQYSPGAGLLGSVPPVAGNTASATRPVATPERPGGEILRAAVSAVEKQSSLKATIHQQVDLFGKHLLGVGEFIQVRRGGLPQVRLQLRVQSGRDTCSMLQVNDGRHLWNQQQFAEETELTRLDVHRVQEALKTAGNTPPPDVTGLACLGGLGGMLRGIEAAFDFTAPAQTGMFGQVPVWRVQGALRPQTLLARFPEQAQQLAEGQLPENDQIPEHIPDRVVVLLHQGSLLPYRVEFLRRKVEPSDAPNASRDRTLMSLELRDLRLGEPVALGLFQFDPGDQGFSEVTDQWLARLAAHP